MATGYQLIHWITAASERTTPNKFGRTLKHTRMNLSSHHTLCSAALWLCGDPDRATVTSCVSYRTRTLPGHINRVDYWEWLDSCGKILRQHNTAPKYCTNSTSFRWHQVVEIAHVHNNRLYIIASSAVEKLAITDWCSLGSRHSVDRSGVIATWLLTNQNEPFRMGHWKVVHV